VRSAEEQNLADADWYKSDLPQWQRAVLWNLRNPLQNFRAFVAGVADKNYTVRGRRRCKVHGGKSTGPRTPEGLERSRRANWKHGHYSRQAKAERSRLRAAILALRELCGSI
jgi:hypothetical protein